MKYELNFWVAGGDMRQAKLAQLLAEDGHRVHTYALEQALPAVTAEDSLDGLGRADCVILPLPVSAAPGLLNAPLSRQSHPLTPLYSALSPGQLVCGGRMDEDTVEQLQARGATVRDYFAREELAVANAVPTVEGAIQIAMEELPITIHGARVLVVGYGRLGKLAAHRFDALGARVSVAARRYEQLAWAQAFGYGTEHVGQLAGWLCSYDLVVNTVPARVLGEAELADLKSDCLIIDLASKPGGVDLDAASRLGRRVVWALSLPGKVAPVTAGASIRDTIYNILHELGK